MDFEQHLFNKWSKGWRDAGGEPAGHNPNEHFVQQAIDILTSRRSFAEEWADRFFREKSYISACRAERRVSRINHVLFHTMRVYYSLGD